MLACFRDISKYLYIYIYKVIAVVCLLRCVFLANGSVWGGRGEAGEVAAAVKRTENKLHLCTSEECIMDVFNLFDLVAEKEGSEEIVTNTSSLMPGLFLPGVP